MNEQIKDILKDEPDVMDLQTGNNSVDNLDNETNEEKEFFKLEKDKFKEPVLHDVNPGEIDLFAELSKPTDKDGKEQKDDEGEGGYKPDRPEPKRDVTNTELQAKLTVAAVNIALGMILQFIASNWTEEGEKKYSLSPSRQQQLLEPLTIMFENSKKKSNPVLILVTTVLVLYIPLFIKAFRERNTNVTEKRKTKFSNIPFKGEITKGERGRPVDRTATTEKERELQEVVSRLRDNLNMMEKHESAEILYPENKEVIKEVFNKPAPAPSMTMEQIKAKVKEIKAKRGARSKVDREFMQQLGID